VPIRIATLADIEGMHIVRMAVRENILSDPSRVRPEHYREMLTTNGRGWVHEENGRIVGFAIADEVHRNIWALFVLPEFEHRGIGRSLHDAMVAWLFVQSAAPVWLSTEPGSRAQHFYRSAGWHEAGTTASGEIRYELAKTETH
jgi:GNAT superfamily N-acetyltransferase